MILFIRRRKLGHGSTRGLVAALKENHGIESVVWRNDKPFPDVPFTHAVRWGCTSNLNVKPEGLKYFNDAKGIHNVADKAGYAEKMWEEYGVGLQDGFFRTPGTIPKTHPKWVWRPVHHAQGRNLYVANGGAKVNKEGYARPLIDKDSEYRVYVMFGRVVAVAKKTPGNPDDVAWNVAQGGRFDNCRWDDWHPNLMRVAIKSAAMSGLCLTGVDIMMEGDKAHFIECNSAPSLPMKDCDGTHTYRHKCIAKGLAWWYHGRDVAPVNLDKAGWRNYIHPSIWNKEKDYV